MSEEKTGFWASLAPAPDELARGLVDNTTTMKIYMDGTFTFKTVFGKETPRDQLVAFDHDADSMRRKSTSERGAAALMTGGLSLSASNNRGVVYVTVTGEQSKVRTFTTRNPSGTTLTSIRSLKSAADSILIKKQELSAADSVDITTQLQKLSDLHASGALTSAEFTAAKTRLLS